MRLAAFALTGALIIRVPAASSAPAVDPAATAIASICTASAYKPSEGKRAITMQPGMGTGGFAISANREAQGWFDYGLKLYHAFYHGDAKLAFAKAAEADPNCAMCVWGQALAEGPTQNYDIDEKERAAALAFAKKAQSMVAGDARDRDLTQALVQRYSGAKKFDVTYAERMQAIAAANPTNDDIAVLAAHAWQGVRGQDEKVIGEKAIALLEPVLKRSPNDSGAIHFYIHASEFAGRANIALAPAHRLAGIAPNASHLVHMAAHTFFRVGEYQDAAVVNADALGVDATYGRSQNQPEALSKNDYYAHNFNFGIAGAMMSGDRALALKFAEHMPVAWPLDTLKGDAQSGSRTRTHIAYALFSPDEALAVKAPGADAPKALAGWHYARGEAFARKGDLAGLQVEIKGLAGKGLFWRKPPGWNVIARHVLEGRAAMLEGKPEVAAKLFAEAAASQEKLFKDNMDPPPWWYPIHRSAAAAHLAAGRHADAVREAETSLKAWPDDPMALVVLSRAEEALGRKDAARDHIARAQKLWRGDLSKAKIETI